LDQYIWSKSPAAVGSSGPGLVESGKSELNNLLEFWVIHQYKDVVCYPYLHLWLVVFILLKEIQRINGLHCKVLSTLNTFHLEFLMSRGFI
jgi:hypothetical protein